MNSALETLRNIRKRSEIHQREFIIKELVAELDSARNDEKCIFKAIDIMNEMEEFLRDLYHSSNDNGEAIINPDKVRELMGKIHDWEVM